MTATEFANFIEKNNQQLREDKNLQASVIQAEIERSRTYAGQVDWHLYRSGLRFALGVLGYQ